ncbi:N-acetyltransferase [Mariniphaga sediminis]|uniref:N-acetyltransferase n=1 Tax=Mariniphaga sediminis TaxID=1628158 RepID=A0A399CU09_9BACT|nr:GNAT family protein [Mariniphaga sediminis]RIH63364.1 N-acetyltransferase [Mariniphaga sediminis]
MEHIQVNTKIRLEAIKLSMAKIIFEAIDGDREYLGEWLPFVSTTQQISDTEAFIKSVISQTEKKSDEIYTIWYNEKFAGLIGFKDTDWINRKTEIGYWLIQNMQGKGIITLCTKQLIKLAFKNMKMNRIQIKVAKGNTKSAAIPSRLGFQHEGTEREGEFYQNRYFDLEVFSFLKSDTSTLM